MVDVKLDSDEWYPVYTYYPKAYAPKVVTMTNAEFVQFMMVQARWERWQSELAWRTGYYTAN